MYHQIARNKRRSIPVIGVFIAAWLVLGAVIGWLFGLDSAGPGDVVPATIGAYVAGILAAVVVVYVLRGGGTRLVLKVAGAVPADPEKYLALHDLIETLAIGDGLLKPSVYIVNDRAPNAFATGADPRHAVIVVTTGMLNLMDHQELTGVLGHEMSHIKNYDVRLLLVVSTLIGFLAMFASLGWRRVFLGTTDNVGRDWVGMIAFTVELPLMVAAFVVGPAIKLALSRSREYLADASCVDLTRDPDALLSALRKLQTNRLHSRMANHATAAMCIDDPLQTHGSWFHRLFDTHPPIEDRIAVLETMVEGGSV